MLNPSLEARYYSRGRLSFFGSGVQPTLVLLFDVVFVKCFGNIELNSEVTGSDSLDIPFDIVVLLNLLNVV